MITAEEWKAYNDAVSRISDGAAASVENAVLGWCRSNPNATVAESREAAKLIMEGYMQSYDGLASAFAAKWYDHQAESNGINLQNAVTASVYVPKKTDSVARYQVRKLTREGPSAFAKACGEYARNDALRALNETIIANVGRDKKKGVRFARVPTGRETCTFCIMLASRGAVYHTRKSAGEFKHFHRHCDCKVVPGFEDDPMATLVQGHDPWVAYRMWKRIETRQRLDGRVNIPSPSELITECEALEKAFRKDPASTLENISSIGVVTAEPGCHLWGKELQEAKWLALLGYDVKLRNPDDHENTSDALIDGQTWDFKRVTSANPNKIAQNILRKKRQGPNWLVDLTLGAMSEDEALCKIASLLEEETVSTVLLITKSHISILGK